MSSSGSGGPPVKRSFPVGTRVPVHSISIHVCFFCGATFPQAPDYQRHIFHEHQMASLAYQLYSEEHPPKHGPGAKDEKKVKKEEKEEKETKEVEKEDKGGKKKKESVAPLPSSSVNRDASSRPSHPPPITTQPVQSSPLITAQPHSTHPPPITSQPNSTPFQLPVKTISAPMLAPGRYPANKRKQPYTPSYGNQVAPSTSVAPGFVRPTEITPCSHCGGTFKNATDLYMHYVHDHDATVTRVEIHPERGDAKLPPIDYLFADQCVHCKVPTPTLTQSYEHMIVHHKGDAFLRAKTATAITYKTLCVVKPDHNFWVQIRLRRQAESAKTTPSK